MLFTSGRNSELEKNMSDLKQKDADRLATSEYEKYQSIINILRGCEEYVLDPAGNILSSNLEAVTITGYEEWEVIGKNISIFYSHIEQLKNKPADDLSKAESRGKHISNGIKVKKRDSPFYAKMKIVALKDSQNNLKGFRVTMQDTTHRVLYNYNVKEIKDEYLHLFNNQFVGIFKFSGRDGKILMMNDKAAKITRRENINQLMFDQLFLRNKDFKNLMDQIKNAGRIEDYEFEMVMHDQQIRWCSISCRYFPIKDIVEGIIVDITDKRKQVAELNKIKTDLDNFIYHASHDLRAPLSTMEGLINLLDIDTSERNVAECKRMLKDRIKFLDQMLREIVAIAYNNTTKIAVERIHIDDLIKNIVKEFRHQYALVNVNIHVTESQPLYSDNIRVLQVLRNIISNAFRFHHSDAPSVSIQCDCNSTEAVFTITDNGIGIPHETQERIFDIFSKGQSKVQGSGLGLYIAKSMVDKLQGHIMVDSDIGRGTAITIQIPNISNH
jgi:PAS domain S-box-containing protein